MPRAEYFSCTERQNKACYFCQKGLCQLLTEPTKQMKAGTRRCGFYATADQVYNDRAKAFEKGYENEQTRAKLENYTEGNLDRLITGRLGFSKARYGSYASKVYDKYRFVVKSRRVGK